MIKVNATVEFSLSTVLPVDLTPAQFVAMTDKEQRDLVWEALQEDFYASCYKFRDGTIRLHEAVRVNEDCEEIYDGTQRELKTEW